MKKIIVTLFIIAAILSLCACGRDDSPAAPSDKDYVPDKSLTFTAESLVSCKQTDFDYDDFYQFSEILGVIPGLKQKFIPQGVSRDEFTGLTFITGYFEENENSVIFVLDQDGHFVKEVILWDVRGLPYVGHSGGIAVTKNHVFVSYGKKLYHLDKKLIVGGGAHLELRFDAYFNVDVNASYVSYSEGFLYVGEFEYAAQKYHTDASHVLFAPDGTRNTALTLQLDLQENSVYGFGDDVQSGDFVVPSLAFSHTERIQGFDYSKSSGMVVLSQSYGRKNNSRLYFHNVSANDATATISISGVEIPVVFLCSTTLQNTVVCPPMTEDIDVCEGNVYICFESAAYKYYEGASVFNKAKNPIDCIFAYEF